MTRSAYRNLDSFCVMTRHREIRQETMCLTWPLVFMAQTIIRTLRKVHCLILDDEREEAKVSRGDDHLIGV